MSALAGIATAMLAFLVLREAQKIRRVEWLAKSQEMWHDFNVSVIARDYADRFEQLRQPDPLTPPFDSRDRLFVYMYLSVVHVEFEALRRKIIDEEYGVETIIDSFIWLKKRRDMIRELMNEGGYDKGFIDLFAEVTKRDDRSAMAEIVLARAKRPAPGWWIK